MESTAQSVPGKVSIVARLIPSFSYATSAAGAALGALLFMGVMRAMRNAESAGIAAVAGGMAQANIPVLVGLYLAIVFGLAGMVVVLARGQQSSAPPRGWFYLMTGGLGLIPVLLLWQAESLLVWILVSPGEGVVSVASQISRYLVLAPVMTVLGGFVLLIASLVPLPALFRAKGKLGPLVVLGLMEIALIVMAVLFQLRTSWLYHVRITESL